MSVTSGFFNSDNHDRMYNAIDMGRMFDGVIDDGIFRTIGDKFTVSSAGGLTLHVGSGRAWFNHTWTLNDDLITLTATAADAVQNRLDAVILDINSTGNVRANNILYKVGALTTETTAATAPHPTWLRTETHSEYPLAYIWRPFNSTEITADQIINAIGTEETPYVQGTNLEGGDYMPSVAGTDNNFVVFGPNGTVKDSNKNANSFVSKVNGVTNNIVIFGTNGIIKDSGLNTNAFLRTVPGAIENHIPVFGPNGVIRDSGLVSSELGNNIIFIKDNTAEGFFFQNNQFASWNNPEIAALPDGTFIIAFVRYSSSFVDNDTGSSTTAHPGSVNQHTETVFGIKKAEEDAILEDELPFCMNTYYTSKNTVLREEFGNVRLSFSLRYSGNIVFDKMKTSQQAPTGTYEFSNIVIRFLCFTNTNNIKEVTSTLRQ